MADNNYKNAQINLAKARANMAALKASAIKKIRAKYGEDAAITNERLKEFGYDEAEQSILLTRRINEVRAAERELIRTGDGASASMSQSEITEIWKKAANEHGVTLEEMAGASNPKPKQESQTAPTEQQSSPTIPAAQIPTVAPHAPGENGTPSSAPSSGNQPSENSQRIDWQKKENKTLSSQYTKTYTSYSGHDMVAIFEIPLEKGSITHIVGELQTISYSMYNEKMPVRVLGDMNMKSVVFGNRTIAGSMVFTVFDRHWAHKMMDEYLRHVGSNAHILTDELPPINITISMCNEYGDKSRLAIYGATFVMEGQTMSVQDMYTENTFQYMAKDLDYLTVNVDSNGGAKSGSHAVEKPKHDNDNTKEEAPVDLPAQETPNKQEVVADKPDYSQAFIISADDLKKGRNHCLAIIDSTLQNLSNTLLSAKENGVITQGQYVEWYASLKKAWQKGRQDVDKYFENQ